MHSTTVALNRGHAEANPLMRWAADNPASLSGIKTLSTAGFIYTAEKIRKRNRKGAVFFMVAANLASVFVVYHNYRVATVHRKGRHRCRPHRFPADRFRPDRPQTRV